MSLQPEKPRGAMSICELVDWAGIGRTTAWKETREGRLRAVKIATRTIIRLDDAHQWLATRPVLQAAIITLS